MKRRVALNGFLLAALVASVAASWVMSADPARPNFEFLPQMAHAPRYNAFASNPNFPDGSTLQPPEAGTIPRGYPPLHYAATQQDALRAGDELQSPLTPDNAWAHQRGEFVFANFCAACHGAGGAGNGPVPQRGYPAPPSLLAEHAIKMKDGQMFHALTYGQNNMPSYASQLSRTDRWNVILYVRAIQKAATPAAAPPSGPAAPAGPQLPSAPPVPGVKAGGQ